MEQSDIRSIPIIPSGGIHPTNVYGNFRSEFFCLMHGASVNFGYVAAAFAADTAVWGYEEIRKRQCYWLDKQLLMKRILKTTNISLWQKHKEKKFAGGMLVDGACCIIGAKTAWIGNFGSASVMEVRNNGETRMMGVVAGTGYEAEKKLGQDRYAVYATSASFPLEHGDSIVIAAGSTALLPREELRAYVNESDSPSVLLRTTGSIMILKKT